MVKVNDEYRLVEGSNSGWRAWIEEAAEWKEYDGELGWQLPWFHEDLMSLDWSPDGTKFVTGGGNGHIMFWDFTTGALVYEHKDDSQGQYQDLHGSGGALINQVKFSHDGKLVASAGYDKTVRVWSFADGHVTQVACCKGHTDGVWAVSWNPDDSRIVSCGRDRDLRVWDWRNEAEVATLEEHTDTVIQVSWSPDGKWLASGGEDKDVLIWDAATGKVVHRMEGHSQVVFQLLWHPESVMLATGAGDETIIIWDAVTGTRETTLTGGGLGGVTSLAWSPCGFYIICTDFGSNMRIWDVESGTIVRQGHHPSGDKPTWSNITLFSPDSAYSLSAARNGTVVLWRNTHALPPSVRFVKGASAERPFKHLYGLKASDVRGGEGGALYLGDDQGSVVRVNTETWDIEASLTGAHTGEIICVAVSPDSKCAVTSGTDRKMFMWNLAESFPTHRELSGPSITHVDRVNEIVWNPTHSGVFATCSWDYKVCVFDADGKELAALDYGDRVLSCGWSADGNILFGTGWMKTVKVWQWEGLEAAKGAEAGGFKLQCELEGHKDHVMAAAASHDGARLVSGSGEHVEGLGAQETVSVVILWDLATGEQIATTPNVGGKQVKSLAWSQDDRYVAVTVVDGDTAILDANTWMVLKTVPTGAINFAKWASGAQLVVGDDSGQLTWWTLRFVPSLPPSPKDFLRENAGATAGMDLVIEAYPWLLTSQDEDGKCMLHYIMGRYGVDLLEWFFEQARKHHIPVGLPYDDRGRSPLDSALGRSFWAGIERVLVELSAEGGVMSETPMLHFALRTTMRSLLEEAEHLAPYFLEAQVPAEVLVDEDDLDASGRTGLADDGNVLVSLPFQAMRDKEDLHAGMHTKGIKDQEAFWTRVVDDAYPGSRKTEASASSRDTFKNAPGGLPRALRKRDKKNAVHPEKFAERPDPAERSAAALAQPTQAANAPQQGIEVALYTGHVWLQSAAASFPYGIVNMMVASSCSSPLFGLPVPSTIINFKWAKYGRARVLRELALYALLLVAFTTFTLLLHRTSRHASLGDLLEDRQGAAAVAMEAIIVILSCRLLWHQALFFRAYGPWRWASSVWRVIGTVSGLVNVAVVVPVHIARKEDNWWLILISINCLFMWSKVLMFAKAFRATGALVQMVVVTVKDMWAFLTLLVIILLGFGNAFYTLFRFESAPDEENVVVEFFKNPGEALLSMFLGMLGEFDIDSYSESISRPFAVFLGVGFQLAVSIVLLNLLIAIMGDSYEKVRDSENFEYAKGLAELIDEVEIASLSKKELARTDWFPRYVHILSHSALSDHEGTEWKGRIKELESRIGALILASERRIRGAVEDGARPSTARRRHKH